MPEVVLLWVQVVTMANAGALLVPGSCDLISRLTDEDPT